MVVVRPAVLVCLEDNGASRIGSLSPDSFCGCGMRRLVCLAELLVLRSDFAGAASSRFGSADITIAGYAARGDPSGELPSLCQPRAALERRRQGGTGFQVRRDG